MKKVISLLLAIAIICASMVFASVSTNAGSTIESAIAWAMAIANDDSHGYSQLQNRRWGNPDYDCSSFVISAFAAAGINTWATYTGNMREAFLDAGFVWIPKSQIYLGDSSQLIRGDILLNEANHTEIYIGDNQRVGAHTGTYDIYDSNAPGDNNGREISVYNYSNSSNWDGVLRLNEGNDPIGVLDGTEGGSGTISISGWAFDEDDRNAQLEIHVYIGGSAGDANAEGHGGIIANGYRPDVNNVYGCGEYHGFEATISTSKTGNQPIYVYAINVGDGENTVIGCGTVNIPVHNPATCIDRIEGRESAVFVKGWAFDEDDLNASIKLHVYIGGIASDSNAEGHVITADVKRTDVNDVYGCGTNHGFSATIPTSKKGTQSVYIYAINIGSGNNVFVGEGTVEISEDTERPTIEQYYTSHIEHDKYRVCVIPNDNVGIKIVRIATWSQDDQSDLIWHEAANNGVGTYYIDINRSDYSMTANSLYHNHIYVYDYAGNERFRSIDMDYKITSETGKNIPEGEYRIVTAVNENRALDVYDNSKNNSANIQIYSNLNNERQTFELEYSEDGFYLIVNSNSGKAIDIANDTYISGTNVIQYNKHGEANQQWMIKPTNDGYYNIIARSNGLALDVYGGYDQDETNVQVWTQNDTLAQKWKLRRVLKDDMVSVKDITVKSETDEINPEITVTVDDNVIAQDGNYHVEVKADITTGKGTVTVTGIDKYCDSVSKEFKINIASAILGDVDDDGEVGVIDATYIQRYDAGFIIPISEEDTLLRGDVDGDEEVGVIDATYIMRFDAGFNTPYPIGEAI